MLLDKIIIIFYFIIAIIEVIAELFTYKPALFIFKPLISVLLIVLYWKTSSQRNLVFFVTLTLALITNLFFIPNTEKMLFFGIVTFLIMRIVMIFYIVKLIKIKDFIPLLLGTIPFLFVFFYLFFISSDIPKNSYYILIVQNILMAIIGGIALSNYMMHDSKKHSWLMIFALLSVAQYFIVFIEKYYLSSQSLIVFRPLAMVLNASVYFTFYKFVMEIEQSVLKNFKKKSDK